MLVDEMPPRRKARRTQDGPLVQNLAVYMGTVVTSEGKVGAQPLALSHQGSSAPIVLAVESSNFYHHETPPPLFRPESFLDYQVRADEASLLEEI